MEDVPTYLDAIVSVCLSGTIVHPSAYIVKVIFPKRRAKYFFSQNVSSNSGEERKICINTLNSQTTEVLVDQRNSLLN